MSAFYRFDAAEIEHPGVLLEEKLREMDMTVKEFAIRADRTEKTVIDILFGKSSVTPEMALSVEYVTGMSAELLLDWQRQYDEEKARKSFIAQSGEMTAWMESFPLDEMRAKGWVDADDSEIETTAALLRFFGIASPSAWENYYCHQKLKVAFRISLEKTASPGAVAAWLRRGEIQSMDMYLDERYDAKRLKSLLSDISLLLLSPPDDIVDRLTTLLADAGIKLIFTEALSGVPIKGATRWIYGWPCIQLLSERQQYEDFRFTVLHEIGHILLHGKKDIFLEHAGFTPDDDPFYPRKEREADAFARKWMMIM